MDRPRVALVHPYWSLWEHTAGPTFRADRLALARRIAGTLEDGFEVVDVADAASAVEGRELGAALAARTPDVLLVLVSMAARRPTRSPSSRRCRTCRSWCGPCTRPALSVATSTTAASRPRARPSAGRW